MRAWRKIWIFLFTLGLLDFTVWFFSGGDVHVIHTLLGIFFGP